MFLSTLYYILIFDWPGPMIVRCAAESRLLCHGRSTQNLKTYGMGTQIMTGPIELPRRRAHEAFLAFLISLMGVLVLIFVVLNILLPFMVARPSIRIAAMEDAVRLGKMDAKTDAADSHQ